MAQYDPNVLQQFADTLYRRATNITISYTFLGFLIGLFVAIPIGSIISQVMANNLFAIVLGAIALIFITFLGYMFGCDRAFFYRLQAQLAMCQKQIEANTGHLHAG